MRGRRTIQKQAITCGECKDARESLKHRTIQTGECFCVICPADGLLKMKKWHCDKVKQPINQKNNRI